MHPVKKASKSTDVEILENIAVSHGGSTVVAAKLINEVKLLVVKIYSLFYNTNTNYLVGYIKYLQLLYL